MSRPARRVNGHVSQSAKPAEVRCAIYTRKSTEQGLEQDINSLTVQRQACEDYVRTRSSDGWQVVPETYDDGGWSGATVKRPAFQQLLADVESGRVHCVVVHRVDRLSRSLLDFARLMAFFQDRGVAFVSVTQNFSTADPVGRLTLNLLATFAEFEREMISARTRDKIAAARKAGRWTGGHVPLGYDLDRGRLVVNAEEAETAREIFGAYLETLSLTRTVELLGRRGVTMKAGAHGNGTERTGQAFDKVGLLRLLRSPVYAGLTRCSGNLTKSEHEAIIPNETWHRVQEHLSRNGSAGYQGVREDQHALLKGLLHCSQCGCRMTPTYTTKGNRRHRYYVCQTRMKKGAHACPTGRVAAHEIEHYVVEQIRTIGRDPLLIAETVRQAKVRQRELVVGLDAEERALRRELRGKRASLRRLVTKGGDASATQTIRERVAATESRLLVTPGEIAAAKRVTFSEAGVRSSLEVFGPIWDSLWPAERARVLGILLERVEHDGREGQIAVRFRVGGLGALGDGS